MYNTTAESHTSSIKIDGGDGRISDAQIFGNSIHVKTSYGVAIDIVKAHNCTIGTNVITVGSYDNRGANVTNVTGIRVGAKADNPSLHICMQDMRDKSEYSPVLTPYVLTDNDASNIEFDGISESRRILSEPGDYSPWGTLFASPVKTNAFATKFPVAPYVVITPTNGHNGMVGAVVIEVTKENFTWRAISAVDETGNVNSYNFTYHAEV
jgi:hypothetical protein